MIVVVDVASIDVVAHLNLPSGGEARHFDHAWSNERVEFGYEFGTETKSKGLGVDAASFVLL